jgi:excisionase family DNA binding protein
MIKKTVAKRGRGRPKGSKGKPKPPVVIDNQTKLGWRTREWARLTSTSLSTTLRQIEAGELRTIRIGRCVLIPRSEAVRLGLVS